MLKKVTKEIDVDSYVNDKFIRQAAKEFGYDYDARLKDYAAAAVRRQRARHQAHPSRSPHLAGQIWVKGEPKVRLYSTRRRRPSPRSASSSSERQDARA